jgi:XTP/dITP diphosphohydrolase
MAADEAREAVVATGNAGKLAEIRSALAGDGWEFVTAADLGREAPEVVEDGRTFLANAEIKARAYHAAFGMPALADDSGLVVDVLGGDPGVRSARYGGEGASDADNNARLLSELEGVGSEERAARFMCVVVFIDADGEETAACGTCEGRIAPAGRGSGGFGYDPLFLPDEAGGRTMAELDLATKNAISHRGRALRALHEELRRGRGGR